MDFLAPKSLRMKLNAAKLTVASELGSKSPSQIPKLAQEKKTMTYRAVAGSKEPETYWRL